MRRLGGRRTCPNGHIFHVESDPPEKEGVCDVCGEPLEVRDDDKPEVIRHRLDQYHEKTEPLIAYYEDQGLLRRVDGDDPEEVTDGSGPCWLRWRWRRRPDIGMYRGGIIIKSPEQIEQMAAAGSIQARCLKMLRSKVRPGVTTDELDLAAERFITSQGAKPSFLGYRGFPGSICASPNSMVVHGIPGPYELHAATSSRSTSASPTRAGWPTRRSPSPWRDRRRAQQLIETTQASLFAAVEQARPGNHLGDSPRGPGACRGRRPLDHPLARRPRVRPRHARGPAGPQLRRAGQGP